MGFRARVRMLKMTVLKSTEEGPSRRAGEKTMSEYGAGGAWNKMRTRILIYWIKKNLWLVERYLVSLTGRTCFR